MRQKPLLRLLGAFAITLGFMLTLSAPASAGSVQRGVEDPRSVAVTSLSAGNVAAATPCGWSTPSVQTAWYNHCGSGPVVIQVEFFWRTSMYHPDRFICVWPGVTNLSTHPSLQGGLITYAYYTRPC
ncbi:DUF6355 family natural product biosynthesis protein [Micromonospora sp. NPDC000663]|uniref:DUF6355 family natural product biosynthesis protein n=1 Tax=Micromonospora sp. NPDC000663 TaxID=3364218 RepID=UPI00367B713A